MADEVPALRRLPSPAALAAAAATLAERLPSGPGRVAFAFENDTAAFVVALLATWARGLAVALPADARRYSVAPLLGAAANVAFLHDTGAGTGIFVDGTAIDPVGGGAHGPWHGPLWWCRATVTAHHERLVPAAELAATVTAAVQRLQLGASIAVHHLFPAGHPAAVVPGLLAPLQAGAPVWYGTGDAALHAALTSAGARLVLTSSWALRGVLATLTGGLPPGGRVVVLGEPPDAATAARATALGLQVEVWERPDPVAVRATAVGLAHGAADFAVECLQVPGEAAPRWFAGLRPGPGTTDDALAAVAAALPQEPLPPVVGFTPRLARDAAGAVPPGQLPAALGRAAHGGALVRELAMAVTAEPGRVTATVRIPEDFVGFAGHFATYPLLGGAVQLHYLLLPCLRRLRGDRVAVHELLDLKFQARIGPGDLLLVEVVDLPGGAVQFTVSRDGTRCCSGRVVVAEEPRP